MRDAVGGSFVIVIIVVFIVLVSAYLAFNVNYTKAFRMKDKIISIYEEYRGNCDGSCATKISDYAKDIGYKPATLKCPAGYKLMDGYYCVKPVSVKDDINAKGDYSKGPFKGDMGESRYYKIVTKIDIRIPIVDNILGIQVFQITGDTKAYPVG